MKVVNKISAFFRHFLPAWKTLAQNWLISLVNKFVPAIVALSLAVIFWRFRLLPPEVPLWYSKPWGSEQLANPLWLFVLPLGSLAIYLLNILLSVYITADLLIFTQILSLTSLTVSLLAFITLVKIIFLVT